MDEYNGAEDIVVTMLHNDGQAGEAVIKRSEGTATVNFTAHESGDYTFVATAQRLGCADKASDVYEVKDFILGVKMPTITWAENKGNGEVYLDWVNISDAKDYTLTYKVKGSDESTAVKIDGITEGDYTVKNLTVGSTYEFSVVANRADGYCSAVSEKELSVTADTQKNWYVSTVGSAQETKATITEADGNAQVINIANGDTDTANTTKWDPSTWPTEEVKGVGLYEAPRGALSHWVAIKDKKCSNYQAVVPTTWNACPRDEVAGQGAFERAMMDTAVKIPEKPLEIVKAIRSFDPCIACATHLYDAKGRTISTVNTDPYIRGGLNG